jgi:uridylate kinase
MFTEISFADVISKRLKIMDSTAFTMCRDNNMPIIVFNMNTRGNLKKIVNGTSNGTLIS